MLTVSAANLGPIANAEVEIRPLTVLTGPSNSGKSYFCTALYALVKTTRPSLLGQHRPRFLAAHQFGTPRFGIRIDAIEVLAQQMEASEKLEAAARVENVRNALAEFFRTAVVAPGLSELDEDFPRYYGRLSGVRRTSAPPRASLSLGLTDSVSSLKFNVTAAGKADKFKLSEYEFSPPGNFPRKQVQPRSSRGDFESAWVVRPTTELMDECFRAFPQVAHYLPAARSGIAQAHKVISSIVVAQSPRWGLRNLAVPSLPGLIADFIAQLLAIDSSSGGSPKLRTCAEFLEREILRGRVEIDKSFPYPEIIYRMKDRKHTALQLHRTSSMVSELAPVVLYLRHLVLPGDLLILEEPESHLHPAAQRTMARLIARLCNLGVTVVITTHSDFFVGQINNLIRSKSTRPKAARAAGLDPSDTLDPAQVSAYEFDYGPREPGSTAKRLAVSKERGIEEARFGEVVDEMYEQRIALEEARGGTKKN